MLRIIVCRSASPRSSRADDSSSAGTVPVRECSPRSSDDHTTRKCTTRKRIKPRRFCRTSTVRVRRHECHCASDVPVRYGTELCCCSLMLLFPALSPSLLRWRSSPTTVPFRPCMSPTFLIDLWDHQQLPPRLPSGFQVCNADEQSAEVRFSQRHCLINCLLLASPKIRTRGGQWIRPGRRSSAMAPNAPTRARELGRPFTTGSR